MNEFIFIPIGSYEQHGAHLPPDTDYLIANKIVEKIALFFNGKTIEGIKIGISPEHKGFKNTKTISKEKFIEIIEDIISKYQDDTKFFLINAHGGNKNALKSLKYMEDKNILALNTFSLIKKDLEGLRSSDIGGICHAGEFETSIMLYLYPKMVKMNRIKKNDVKYVPFLDPNYKKERPREWKTMDFNKKGILGDPFHANSKKGELWFNTLIVKIKSLIKQYIN
ncbi:MAG: creatininase family protein [Candidatus Odinarchaeota archaeon]